MNLLEATENELARMIARNLEGSPAADEIVHVASVYADDFRNRGLTDDDAERIQAAFRLIGGKVTRFPPPAQILECLPAREPQKMLEHEITDEERERNLERLDAMMRKAGLR